MQLSCKCLNVIINSKGSVIDDFNLSTSPKIDHPFFKTNIGSVELESIHKEQAALVAKESCGQWLVHHCLNCNLYTHALDTGSTAVVLVNRNMLVDPNEIAALKNSDKFSPVFHIVIDSADEDANAPIPGVRGVSGSAALHQQLTEWVQRQVAATEERVRQFSEQQYAALEQLRARAHRDHLTLSRTLVEASSGQKAGLSSDTKLPTSQFNSSPSVTKLPQTPTPVLPDPNKAISKRPAQMGSRRNVARKPSVDAEGLFDLDGMDDQSHEPFVSDEEIDLSDTDESGSHDEGIHIPRHVSAAIYAKSLPVNVPVFAQHSSVEDSPHRHEYRVPQQPMDIAASIKALAKSVHGDAVFGDLPRPRFSSQI
ncbi:uncharacterized protein LOC129005998 [Macrosteles quadrilineatus]|uniref:uncharacterized protein LOC128986062 n=1 Tax=Macrosteles quadrilineatus TaxID=74068 RepID=UPI0023E2DA1D|nr:uncharacterized protein LOC128986062 [Macrosteles quadrilineatus]XP_054291056.1 uncharacterized protein LOC129005998 [Macrosteles quadrilineatus]